MEEIIRVEQDDVMVMIKGVKQQDVEALSIVVKTMVCCISVVRKVPLLGLLLVCKLEEFMSLSTIANKK